MEKPKYRVGQMLKAEHSWARDIPPRPVLDIMFDKSWNCYTYSFPRSLIRLEEYHLNPVDLPDMTPYIFPDTTVRDCYKKMAAGTK